MKVDAAIRTLLAGDVYDNAIEDLRTAIDSPALRSTTKVSDRAISRRNGLRWTRSHLGEAERLRDELPTQMALAAADRNERPSSPSNTTPTNRGLASQLETDD